MNETNNNPNTFIVDELGQYHITPEAFAAATPLLNMVNSPASTTFDEVNGRWSWSIPEGTVNPTIVGIVDTSGINLAGNTVWWENQQEHILRQQSIREREAQLMWGTPVVQGQGLYGQMRDGNTVEYNPDGALSMDNIRSAMEQLYYNNPNQQRRVTVQTGEAGMKMFNNALKGSMASKIVLEPDVQVYHNVEPEVWTISHEDIISTTRERIPYWYCIHGDKLRSFPVTELRRVVEAQPKQPPIMYKTKPAYPSGYQLEGKEIPMTEEMRREFEEYKAAIGIVDELPAPQVDTPRPRGPFNPPIIPGHRAVG